jgi:N-acyl homoserine lactone hydrolase
MEKPMRLAVLDYGLFEVYQNGRQIGIQGFLIDTGTRNILVDTGFHADYIADPVGVCNADGLGDFGMLRSYNNTQNPHAQLALLGLRNVDITDLVISHGHVDHVGRIEEFPNATLWISAQERAKETPSYWNGYSRVRWPDIPTQTVTHATQIAPGVLFFPTPGHTLGHFSLTVLLPQMGMVILAADAISRPDEFDSDTWGDAEDPDLARQSAHMLRHLAMERQAWLIYGHSPQQWRVLQKAPHWYH